MKSPSLYNYAWDCFIRSFENKESLIEATNGFSENEKISILYDAYGDLGFWERVYVDRKSIIVNNIKMQIANEVCSVDSVEFHEKFGWTIGHNGFKAYLGKMSFSQHTKTTIGHRSYISGDSIIRGNGTINIGSFCSIASGMYINVSSENHPIRYPASIGLGFESRMVSDHFLSSISLAHQKPHITQLTEIGSDVWIGRNVTIFPGLKLNHGCVIGANSLVTKNCDSYGIYGGIPAKLIRYRFSANIIEDLLKVEWWNWDEKKILKNKVFFSTDLTNHEGSIKNLLEC